MKKRIKLKRKNYLHIKKRDKAVIIIIMIFITTMFFSFLLNKKSNTTVLSYAKNKTTLLSTSIINNVINEYSDIFKNKDDFISESKDKDGSIVSIDFNTVNVNKSLTIINKKIIDNLKELEQGKISDFDVGEYEIKENNIVYFLPFGIITNNIFLNSLGPKIPLKMNTIGRVISNIKTEIMHYGINNALFRMYIEVEVTGLILLPFISEEVKVNVSVPIVIKIIEGNVPNVYGGLITASSALNTLNVD